MAIQLQIPAPCDEKWSDMTPVRHDCRHCAVCDRQIVDFTMKTDAELLDYLKQHTGKICGKFNVRQLERPLQARKQIKRGGLTAAAASFTAILAAQQPTGNPVAQPVLTQQIPKDQVILGKPAFYQPVNEVVRTISGKLLDETDQPLFGAIVVFANTGIRTTSDMEGFFKLQVPIDTLKNNPLEIEIRYPGYLSKMVTLAPRILEEDLALLPAQTRIDQEEIQMLMGVMIADYPDIDIEQRPAFKDRVRNFFHKLF